MAKKNTSSKSKPQSKTTGGTGASATGKDAAAVGKIQGQAKVDTAAPESPVVPDPDKISQEGNDPKDVKAKEGETAAQHEAHALLSSDERIAERIRIEQEEGLPTDVVARRQQEEALNAERGRITGDRGVRARGGRQAA